MSACGAFQHSHHGSVIWVSPDGPLVDQSARRELIAALHAKSWCYEKAGVAAGDQACERFAAALAWAYWPVAANSLKPRSASDWSAAIPATAFRVLLGQLLEQS